MQKFLQRIVRAGRDAFAWRRRLRLLSETKRQIRKCLIQTIKKSEIKTKRPNLRVSVENGQGRVRRRCPCACSLGHRRVGKVIAAVARPSAVAGRHPKMSRVDSARHGSSGRNRMDPQVLLVADFDIQRNDFLMGNSRRLARGWQSHFH